MHNRLSILVCFIFLSGCGDSEKKQADDKRIALERDFADKKRAGERDIAEMKAQADKDERTAKEKIAAELRAADEKAAMAPATVAVMSATWSRDALDYSDTHQIVDNRIVLGSKFAKLNPRTGYAHIRLTLKTSELVDYPKQRRDLVGGAFIEDNNHGTYPLYGFKHSSVWLPATTLRYHTAIDVGDSIELLFEVSAKPGYTLVVRETRIPLTEFLGPHPESAEARLGPERPPHTFNIKAFQLAELELFLNHQNATSIQRMNTLEALMRFSREQAIVVSILRENNGSLDGIRDEIWEKIAIERTAQREKLHMYLTESAKKLVGDKLPPIRDTDVRKMFQDRFRFSDEQWENYLSSYEKQLSKDIWNMLRVAMREYQIHQYFKK